MTIRKQAMAEKMGKNKETSPFGAQESQAIVHMVDRSIVNWPSQTPTPWHTYLHVTVNSLLSVCHHINGIPFSLAPWNTLFILVQL